MVEEKYPLNELIKEAPKTVDEGIEECKAGIWACLVWVNKDNEKTEEIFKDLYSWLDLQYDRHVQHQQEKGR